MRGSRGPWADGAGAGGIIPADAGLTSSANKYGILTWDHPRGCGAHPVSILMAARILGSSPRMRGSRYIALTQPSIVGIIPADAGLTLKNPNNYAIPYSFSSQNHSLLSILTGYLILFIRLSQLRLNTLSVFAMTLQTPAILTYRKGTAEAVPFCLWLLVAIRSCS